MRINNIERRNAGFTLVELLVVTAIMGLVVMGIYGVFLSMNKNTYKQEELVEVQQNLRVAMGQVAMDIRMAGFLVPLDLPPIQVADANTISIRNATISGRVAQISSQVDTYADELVFEVETPEMVDLFDTTDHKYVRIIRLADREQRIGAVFTVTGKNRVGPTLTLKGFGTPVPSVSYVEGDVIVEVPSAAATHPRIITYELEANGDLLRDGQVVGAYLSDIVFEYLREDGTSIATPVSAGELGDIRAIRVTMSGSTDPVKTALTDGVKTRQLSQVVRIRNVR